MCQHFELVAELGRIAVPAGEQTLHALGAALLRGALCAPEFAHVLIGDGRHQAVEDAGLVAQHLAQHRSLIGQVLAACLLHQEVPEQRAAEHVTTQHGVHTHPDPGGAVGLGDRLRRDRAEALPAPLYAVQSVVDGRGDRRSQPGDVLGVVVSDLREDAAADAREDRVLQLGAARAHARDQLGSCAIARHYSRPAHEQTVTASLPCTAP